MPHMLRALRWIALFVPLFALSWLHQDHYDFQHDDAYISYRYAQNWAHGHGPVYNPGERVEGYSNFLLVAALRGAIELGLDPVRTSRALGTFACFVLMALAGWFVVVLLGRSWRWGAAAAGALALHAAIATWARGGLETLLVSAGVLAALGRLEWERRSLAPHVVSAGLFAVVALLRIDGSLFFAASGVFLVAVRTPIRRLAPFVAVFAAIVLPWFLWRWQWYGWLFPNSFYLKTGGDVWQKLRGVFYSYNFVMPFGGFLLFALPGILLVFRDARRDRARALLAATSLLFGAYVVWVGGDHMPMSRFIVPLVAPWTILVLEAVLELGRGLPARRGRLVGAGLVAVILVSGALPTFNRRRPPFSSALMNRAAAHQWSMAGEWLRAHVDSTAVLATDPAGAIAYTSRLRIIDMLGVNDLHIAHLRVPTMGRGTAGHEKRDFAYVLERVPDLIFRGVDTTCVRAGAERRYPDGSVYVVCCESLGVGPIVDLYGTEIQAPLVLRYESRRRAGSDASPLSAATTADPRAALTTPDAACTRARTRSARIAARSE